MRAPLSIVRVVFLGQEEVTNLCKSRAVASEDQMHGLCQLAYEIIVYYSDKKKYKWEP